MATKDIIKKADKQAKETKEEAVAKCPSCSAKDQLNYTKKKRRTNGLHT